jgi:hypothetical protein
MIASIADPAVTFNRQSAQKIARRELRKKRAAVHQLQSLKVVVSERSLKSGLYAGNST